MTEDNQVKGELRNAYLFYTVAISVPLEVLVKSILVMAKNCGFDACTALAVGDLLKVFQTKINNELMFVKGSGTLRYYLFNWRGMQLRPRSIQFVAL